VRIGDPDNGYQVGRVTLVADRRKRSGCSDEAGEGPLAYNRIVVADIPSFGRQSATPLLQC